MSRRGDSETVALPSQSEYEAEMDAIAEKRGTVARNWNFAVAALVIAAGAIGVGLTQGYFKNDTSAGIIAVISNNLPNTGPAVAQYPIDIVLATGLMGWGVLLLILNFWSPEILAHNAFTGDQWFQFLFNSIYRFIIAFVLAQTVGITDWITILFALGCFQAMGYLYYINEMLQIDTTAGMAVFTERLLEAGQDAESHDETIQAHLQRSKIHHKEARPHVYVLAGFALLFAWTPIFAMAISTIIVQGNLEGTTPCPAREGITISFFILIALENILEYVFVGLRHFSKVTWLRGVGNWPPLNFVAKGIVLTTMMLLYVGQGYELYKRVC